MKKLVCKLVLFAVVLAVSLPVVAAEGRKRGEGKKKGDQGAVAQMMSRIEKLGLSAEKLKEIKDIVAEYAPKIEEANKAIGPELRKEMMAARKKASDDGKKGKEAEQAAQSVLKTQEQKDAFAKAQELTRAMQKAVAAKLTPEQVKEAGLGGRTGGKKRGN